VHNSLTCRVITIFGTEEQKKKYLPRLASGEIIGAYAITEPDIGSDAANIKLSAQRNGDKYILNGMKSWISTGAYSGCIIVFARTKKSEEKPHRGISAFIVEPTFKGFSFGKKEKKLGLRASDTRQLIFDNAEVPAENLLGKENEGFKIMMQGLDGGRIGIAAESVGLAQAALEAAISYSKVRKQFGKFLYEFEMIQQKIADMGTRVEAARLLTWRAAKLKDAGLPHSKEASMAKLFASETSFFCATEAVQIYGGYGYTKEYPVERYFRDSKVNEIFEGTSEIQRIVIARHLLGLVESR
jgi:alkylation response protein AidB-like acyl-CoA dehydrogenase